MTEERTATGKSDPAQINHSWLEYIAKTKGREPRALLQKALVLIKDRDAALDLGAGALNDSRYLLESGFQSVMAIDRELIPEEVIKLEWARQFSERFSFNLKSIEDFVFPVSAFNLVNAQFVLPFIEKTALSRVLDGIKSSLRPGGIFTGQFFGERDSWQGQLDGAVYSEKECRDFLAGLEIVYFKEDEYDGPSLLNGEKHWHLYNFIAQK